eukprot:scaffold7850_cov171-Amphora_coffeaeformis.AAC.4
MNGFGSRRKELSLPFTRLSRTYDRWVLSPNSVGQVGIFAMINGIGRTVLTCYLDNVPQEKKSTSKVPTSTRAGATTKLRRKQNHLYWENGFDKPSNKGISHACPSKKEVLASMMIDFGEKNETLFVCENGGQNLRALIHDK